MRFNLHTAVFTLCNMAPRSVLRSGGVRGIIKGVQLLQLDMNTTDRTTKTLQIANNHTTLKRISLLKEVYCISFPT